MKISDIAKKLGISIKQVRDQAKDRGFVIAQKSNTMSDVKAKEFIDAISKEKEKNSEDSEAVLAEKTKEKEDVIKEVCIPEVVSVKGFSEKLEVPVTKVITELMKNGVMASLNENIDFETASIIGEYLGFSIIKEEDDEGKCLSLYEGEGEKKTRPPIITIIGHVDHGKTKLLDSIRKANVIDTESGGITQHIGAYQVERKGRKITFLDTPGHAAFSAMREHGVRITDVAVLVVAADDGVKPQTKESVNFAREAGVPIVVAINKIDKPEANIEKTKKELSDIGLIPEDWGGNTVMANISAKSGQGIEELLDLILLVADMKKIEGYYDVPANGFVIESKLSSGKGPVATILVRDGVLRLGDAVTVGRGVFGKIRSMSDYKGRKVREAYPSDPVRVSGLSAVPNFGEVLEVEKTLVEAKAKIEKYKKNSSIKKINQSVLSLSSASSALSSGDMRELRIIIKSDVMGSLKAIRDSFDAMKYQEVGIKIINEGIGDINDSDVKMAQATDSIILGFRVGVTTQAKRLLENNNMEVEIFDIIYELIDKVNLALSGLLEPELVEKEIGKAVVLKIFKDGKRNKILGIRISSGKFERGGLLRFYRNGDFMAEGKMSNLKECEKNVNEIEKGKECGVEVSFHLAEGEKVVLQEGDEIHEIIKESIKKELTKAD